MDSVQQSPLAVERNIAVVQFLLDFTETLHHDALTDPRPVIGPLAEISARCDDTVAGDVRLRIADEHDGEHIDLLGVEIAQSRHAHLLLRTTGLPHKSDRRRSAAPLQEKFLQTVQLPITVVAAGM